MCQTPNDWENGVSCGFLGEVLSQKMCNLVIVLLNNNQFWQSFGEKEVRAEVKGYS
jgi:hypothetical protein